MALQQQVTSCGADSMNACVLLTASVVIILWLVQLYPTVQQATAMRRLVSSLRLAPDVAAAAGLGPDREQLVPEDTLNPLVQRFYTFMGQRALDPQHQVCGGRALRGQSCLGQGLGPPMQRQMFDDVLCGPLDAVAMVTRMVGCCRDISGLCECELSQCVWPCVCLAGA